VIRPIAFAQSAYAGGGQAPMILPEFMVFRDERGEFQPWDDYAWSGWGSTT
jgi:hypothetical protein